MNLKLELENKVAELERMNLLMVDREVKMKELKNKFKIEERADKKETDYSGL